MGAILPASGLGEPDRNALDTVQDRLAAIDPDDLAGENLGGILILLGIRPVRGREIQIDRFSRQDRRGQRQLDQYARRRDINAPAGISLRRRLVPDGHRPIELMSSGTTSFLHCRHQSAPRKTNVPSFPFIGQYPPSPLPANPLTRPSNLLHPLCPSPAAATSSASTACTCYVDSISLSVALLNENSTCSLFSHRV